MFKSNFTAKPYSSDVILSVLNTLPIGVLIHDYNHIIFINKIGLTALNIDKNKEKKVYSLPLSHFLQQQKSLSINDKTESALFTFNNFKNQLFDIEANSSFIKLNGLKVNQLFFKHLSKKNNRNKINDDKSVIKKTGESELKTNKQIELVSKIVKLENKLKEQLAQDTTEKLKTKNKLLEQSAKLKAIFESGNQLIWTVNDKFKLTSFNQKFANFIFDIYGYYPELRKVIKRPRSSIYNSFWKEKYNLVLQGKHIEFILERTIKNGEKITTQIFLAPIKNSNNQVLEISAIGFDMTENKKNEEKLTQSLKEKEVLLKELHHRVKNNMQVISSILNLQSSYVKDDYAYNLLKECQNRIKTMAFIHESLYQSKNLESVNFSEYVGVLSKNLIHSYTISSRKIKLVLTLDDLMLSIDYSIPCGLIINEIISNSLKYAFPDDRDGIIFVTLEVSVNRIYLIVGDNGIGIPESIDIKDTQTLGLQLVNTLVEQLNGKISLIRKTGTKFLIEFNI